MAYDGDNLAGTPSGDIESLAIAPDGTVYLGLSTEGLLLRLRDLDGNGDFQGPLESSVFYAIGAELGELDIDAIGVDPGGILYVANEDTGDVWACDDVDASGAIDQVNESHLFLDPSNGSGARDINDLVVLGRGQLALADGSNDTVWIVTDIDGDGRATGEEIVDWSPESGDLLSTPSALAVWSTGEVEPPLGSEFIRGDIDESQTVVLADALLVLEFLFLGEPVSACHDAVDVDDDGQLRISDGIYLLNWLFDGGAQPPAPFPEAGADPTADALDCSRTDV